MARGKKKEENLTLEEKLKQALVPVEEWPYEVPGNWCWTRLKWIAKWGSGGTPSRKNPEYYTGNIPWVKTGELNDGNIYFTEECITEDALNHSSAKLYPAKTIIMAMYGATIGKTAILEIDASTNQACACAVCLGAMNYKYLFYYLRLQTECFVNKGKGGAQPNISQEIIKEHEIPLPPLREQQRIIFHFENLFTKLDEAKEKVQCVLESSENRKSAILHKAFSGELTEQWRQEHKIQIDSWVHIDLKQVCEVNPKKSVLQHLNNNMEVSFFPMAAISEASGKVINPQLRSLKEVRTGFTSFREGDVIFAKITPCMENGKSAVVEKLVNDIGFGSTEFYVLRCNSRLFNRYLHYIIRNRQFRDCAKEVMTGAVGQQRVPKSFIEEYLLYLPTVDEQKEVVRLLDGFIKREQEVEAKCKDLITNIDLLKKSILSRAFRGELGTNNPDEGSAIELLKTIL